MFENISQMLLKDDRFAALQFPTVFVKHTQKQIYVFNSFRNLCENTAEGLFLPNLLKLGILGGPQGLV